MSEKRQPVITSTDAGVLTQVLRTLRLVWRLLNDARVSRLPKLIIPAAILYVLSPVDFLPDLALGLGQLDDVGIIALAVALFIEACPRAIVEEHRRALAVEGTSPTREENIIEGSYREISDDPPRR